MDDGMSVTVAYLSAFVPEEWVVAHGLRARRVVVEGGEAAGMGVCALAAGFARCVVGADGVVFATTCDQMRRMAERVEMEAGRVFLMNVPATWETVGAVGLYQGELRRLGRFLERLGGVEPTNEKLAGVMRECEKRRRRGEMGEGIRVGLVGSMLRGEDRWIEECVRGAGGCVALDAREGGERCWPGRFDEGAMGMDALGELARAYFRVIPDAFRRPDRLLHEYLEREVKGRGIRGLILVRYVWCDQWHAQLERLKENLKIPVVEVDLGGRDHDVERIRTRIESLVSILK